MTVQTLPDITPNSAAVPFTTNQDLLARSIMITASGNSCRVGDANVGSNRGALLPNGIPVVLNPPEFADGTYPLAKFYGYATGTDKISITYF